MLLSESFLRCSLVESIQVNADHTFLLVYSCGKLTQIIRFCWFTLVVNHKTYAGASTRNLRKLNRFYHYQSTQHSYHLVINLQVMANDGLAAVLAIS